MDLTVDGHTYGIATGGYESAIPTDSIHELEESTYCTRSYRGGFPAEELDLVDIFTSEMCTRQPQFTIQFGRSDDANESPTYQALGTGIKSLQYADNHLRELAHEIEEDFDHDGEFATHRPLIRAHTSLSDGSVLYVEVYYYGQSADSIKRFELVTFHPKIPFNPDQYDEIYEASPTQPPNYVEEVEISTKRDFEILNYSPPSVIKTETFRSQVTEIAKIENPMRDHRQTMERPWNVFKSPHQLYGELHLYDGNSDQAGVTALRAVSPEIIEPVFYHMEIS